ncbi:MAG: hypothetical protein JNJ84_15045 [Rhodobacteraceae bacterium]|nr:hypothetical protein [Paracoccaceae bacterium]
MLETSPRWDRHVQAALETAYNELKPVFSVLYYFSVTCSVVYMVGWLNFNLGELPVAPMSLHTMVMIGLTAVAGILFVLMLPMSLIAFGIDRRLSQRIRRLDQTVGKIGKHRLIAVQALPNLQEAAGGTHGQHHHQKP